MRSTPTLPASANREVSSVPAGRGSPRTTATCALAALLLVSACGAASTRPYVAGPYVTPQETLFRQLTEGTRSAGYELLDEDAARGRFAVRAHTTLSRGQTALFVVQCYSPGWLQVTVEGPSIRRVRDTMSMPGGLHDEYRDFTLALMEGIESGRPAARSPR